MLDCAAVWLKNSKRQVSYQFGDLVKLTFSFNDSNGFLRPSSKARSVPLLTSNYSRGGNTTQIIENQIMKTKIDIARRSNPEQKCTAGFGKPSTINLSSREESSNKGGKQCSN